MIRSKILAVAAAGAVALGGFALAAPAGADVNTIHTLGCGGTGVGAGGLSLGKLVPGISFGGIQTKSTSALFTDLTAPPAKLGGICTAHLGDGGRLEANGGKPGIPGSGAQTLTLHATTFSSTLTGYASCNSAAPPGTAASADYPLNGLLTAKFAEGYTDTVTLLPKFYSAQAYISTNGFVSTPIALADYLNIIGTGTKGIGAGAKLTGQIFFDPVKKPVNHIDYDIDGLDPLNNPIPTVITGTAAYSAQTGMMLDLGPAVLCAGNLGGTIAQIEIGTGTPSLLGTANPNAGIFLDLP